MPAALPNITQHKIADAMAQGANGRSVAKALGLDEGTVSRYKKKLRKDIEALSLVYFSQAAPLAVDSSLAALRLCNQVYQDAANAPTERPKDPTTGKPDMTVRTRADILAEHKDLLAVADKKEGRALRDAGISASPAASIFVTNLMISGNQTVLLPQIQQLFGGNVSQCESDDIIDVDVRECDSGPARDEPFVGNFCPNVGDIVGDE